MCLPIYFGQFGLADTGFAFEEQRAAHGECEVQHGGQAVVAQIVVCGELGLELFNGVDDDDSCLAKKGVARKRSGNPVPILTTGDSRWFAADATVEVVERRCSRLRVSMPALWLPPGPPSPIPSRRGIQPSRADRYSSPLPRP